jgi:hypothetical protein
MPEFSCIQPTSALAGSAKHVSLPSNEIQGRPKHVAQGLIHSTSRVNRSMYVSYPQIFRRDAMFEFSYDLWNLGIALVGTALEICMDHIEIGK